MEPLTHEEIEFLKYSLNIAYMEAFTKLQRKWELGDIEVKNYEHQKQESKRLMEKLERVGVV
jgi:hypothetical protein